MRWMIAVAALALAGSTLAIERYKLRILPDMGYGGEVLAFQKPGGEFGERRVACGYAKDPQNGKRMTVWADFREPYTNYRMFVVDEVPPGVANDVMLDPGGLSATAVGSAGGQAVVCRVRDNGISSYQLLDDPRPGWTAYEAIGIDLTGPRRIIVGNSAGPNGAAQIVVWREVLPGVLEFSALPSEGHVFLIGHDFKVVQTGGTTFNDVCTIGGRIVPQAPQGTHHAAMWTSTDGGNTWELRQMHPGRSQLNGIGRTGSIGSIVAVGDASTSSGNGTTAAFFIGNDPPSFFDDGNDNSSGIACFRSGQRTWSVIISGYGNQDDRRSYFWAGLSNIPTSAILVDDTIVDPDGTAFDGKFDCHDGIPEFLVGSAFWGHSQGGLTGPPALAVADGFQLPDDVEVLSGDPVGNWGVADVWHAGDGKELPIRFPNDAPIQFVTKWKIYAPLPSSISFRLRGKTNRASGRAVVKFVIRNQLTGNNDVVGTFTLTGEYQTFTVEVDAATYVNQETRDFRVKSELSKVLSVEQCRIDEMCGLIR